MNIDELWWVYRRMQYLQELSIICPPSPAERACFSVWPPPYVLGARWGQNTATYTIRGTWTETIG